MAAISVGAIFKASITSGGSPLWHWCVLRRMPFPFFFRGRTTDHEDPSVECGDCVCDTRQCRRHTTAKAFQSIWIEVAKQDFFEVLQDIDRELCPWYRQRSHKRHKLRNGLLWYKYTVHLPKPVIYIYIYVSFKIQARNQTRNEKPNSCSHFLRHLKPCFTSCFHLDVLIHSCIQSPGSYVSRIPAECVKMCYYGLRMHPSY